MLVGQRQAPVGDQVAADGQHRDRDRQRQQRRDHHGDAGHREVTRVEGQGELGQRRQQRTGDRQPGARQGCVAAPGRVEAQHRACRGGLCLEAGLCLDSSLGWFVGGCGGALAQQLGAQLAGRAGAQPVEVEVLLAGAGADAHGGQVEDPLDQRGGGVDGADPVDAGRQQVALQQPPAQLDAPLVDPVGRRHVAQHAQRDRHQHAQQLPADADPAAGGGAEHEHADEDRHEAQHLAHRVDQQHPAVQALPVLAHRRPSLTWRPRRPRRPSRSARRPAARRCAGRDPRPRGRRPPRRW